ncbi:MAG: flagellar basal-body rod protein FlgG [Planctomycetes bacterium]|nr:flagellar basal-body rod protein FlgG [Planctomycetota bacterium]
MAIVSLHSAASGLSALNTQLDVIANNLANVNTQGFKGSRVNFQDLLYQEKALPGTENAAGDQRPTGLYVGLGVKVSGTQLDFRQGSLLRTDNPLDMAIEENGNEVRSFFRVRVEPDRAPNGIAFTRAGNFTRNRDGELVLASDTGRRLDPPITIPQEAISISVNTDGEVFYTTAGSPTPQSAGRITLSGFINPAGLKQIGENLYTETEASGPAVDGNPGEGALGIIRGGVLEASNVDPTRELVELIRTQRAFEMNSNVIRAADDTLRAVAQLRR